MGNSHNEGNEGVSEERKEYFLSKCMKASQIRDSTKETRQPSSFYAMVYGIHVLPPIFSFGMRVQLNCTIYDRFGRFLRSILGVYVYPWATSPYRFFFFFIWLRILVIKTILNWR